MKNMQILTVLAMLVLSISCIWASCASCSSCVSSAQCGPKASEKMGWQLGVQAWSFNKMTFFEAVDNAKTCGLKYIEAFPGQKVSADMGDAKMGPGLSLSQIVKIKKKLDNCGVSIAAYGVCHLGSDKEKNRETFDFAKIMGIKVINSEPDQKNLAMLDALANEYKIKVGLHNHPKNSRYWSPDIVLAALKDLSPMVGACADTGHWVRSGLDPQECLKKLSGKIVSMHMKDMNQKARNCHDVPWGTGVCNMKAIMAQLKAQGFKGPVSAEYEHNWGKNVPDVKKCADFFEKTCTAMLAK